MTSKQDYKEAFDWIWLTEEHRPAVTNPVAPDANDLLFNYLKNYLEVVKAAYKPEFTLRPSVFQLFKP